MKKEAMTFRVTQEEMVRIDFEAKHRNVSRNTFVRGCVDEVLSGHCIDRKILQQKSIELMNATQRVKDENPNVDIREIERIGGELCQISL